MLHSVQKPVVVAHQVEGIETTFRDYLAGSALGVQNFFLEVHPDPDSSPSDGPNSIRLSDFENN